MRAEEFDRLKTDLEGQLIAMGCIREGDCLRGVCNVLISQPKSIEPRQLAELMDFARHMAVRNMDRWLKITPLKRSE